MTSKLKLLLASAFCGPAAIIAMPAYAEGTAAATPITNNVSVNYQVGGVAQTAATATDTFVVDRKINFTVAEATPTGTTSVSPGQQDAVTTFIVTNTTNGTVDFALALTQQANGATAAHGGTDAFDVTTLRLFVDSNNNGVYNPGVDTATFIDELPADGSVRVFAVGNIPLGLANGLVSGVTLTATVREGGATGLGAVITPATDATVNGAGTVETVFADAGRDGVEAANDDYTVAAATLSANKYSRVISDGVSTTNPKALPGAIVEYCIAITNAAGSASATSVSISDVVPANLIYQTAFGIQVGTSVTTVAGTQVCSAATVADATTSFGSNTVTGTFGTIAGGATRTVIFRAEID